MKELFLVCAKLGLTCTCLYWGLYNQEVQDKLFLDSENEYEPESVQNFIKGLQLYTK